MRPHSPASTLRPSTAPPRGFLLLLLGPAAVSTGALRLQLPSPPLLQKGAASVASRPQGRELALKKSYRRIRRAGGRYVAPAIADCWPCSHRHPLLRCHSGKSTVLTPSKSLPPLWNLILTFEKSHQDFKVAPHTPVWIFLGLGWLIIAGLADLNKTSDDEKFSDFWPLSILAADPNISAETLMENKWEIN